MLLVGRRRQVPDDDVCLIPGSVPPRTDQPSSDPSSQYGNAVRNAPVSCLPIMSTPRM